MLGPAGFGSCEGVLLVAPRLQPWYKVVSPRADLREGKPLDAAEFAVHLDQVRTGEAPPDYQEPKRFLERTYLTKSLTELAGEVCRRLSGETVEASAVFNLSTQFGGGKTHALTLLYHLATIGAAADDLPGIRKVLDYGRIASVPKAAVGVFVGTEVDVITGRGGHDGTPRRRTPWGELAYQLGGPEAFRHVAEHEKDPVTAPSSEVIRAFLPDDRPCLILIDELMNYVNRGRSRGLADQVYSFLHTLSEEARRHQNVVLAVSVPASELEMTAEDHADYERLRKLLDRVGKPVAMSAGAETSEIIRRRLFEWEGLPREANKTAGAYAQWVLEHRKQLPQWFPVDRAAEEFQASYPFHPALLSVFERKWQSLPHFQRTRGILRLLALWVSKAYERGYKGVHSDPAIGTGTAPLDDLMFRQAMFQQLGNDGLEGAVTTDICGASDAHALRLDDEAVQTISRARLHEKAAIAAFFESNGGQTQDHATEPEIRLAVSEPDLDLGNIETALDQLASRCYYLTAENRRYRFSQTPNLNKLLADRRASIDEARAAERVREEVQSVFREGPDVARVFFPEQSSQVPDRPVLSLVVLGPDGAAQGEAATSVWLRQMTMEYGSSGRTFKSALVWCVPEAGSALNDEARKLLAWEDISLEQNTLRLDDTDRAQLKEHLARARRDLRETVWRAYKNVWLLGPDNEMQKTDLGLVHSSAAKSLAELVLARLRESDELTDSVAPSFLVRTGNWPPAFGERGWPTKAVRDAFFASPQFPRLMKGDSIKDTIARGVSTRIFAYVGVGEGGRYEPFLFGESMTADEVELSDSVALIGRDTAEAYQARMAQQPADEPELEPDHQPDDKGKPDIEPPQPPVDKPVPAKAAKLTWSGDLPPQKWTNFYKQVLTRFAVGKNLSLGVTFTVQPDQGLSPQEIADTQAALRELGLSDDTEVG